MAKVVRKKVAGAATKSRKNIFKSVWFWVICVASALAIGGLIWLTIYLVDKYTNDDDAYKDYIRETEEVDFQFASYSALINYISPDYTNPQDKNSLFKENVIIFAYNSKEFFPNEEYSKEKYEDSEDPYEKYVEADKDLLNRLINLQKAVDGNKKFEMYIVDVSVGNNYLIFYDEDMCGFLTEDNDSSTNTPALLYIENGEFKPYEDMDNSKTPLCTSAEAFTGGTSVKNINSTYCTNLTNYIKAYE